MSHQANMQTKQSLPIEPVSKMVGSFASAASSLSATPASNKIQLQKVSHLIQQQQQQRRKWSDWSLCSPKCIRTRHRRTCDDIVAAQQQQQQQAQNLTSTATTVPISTATTPLSSTNSNIKRVKQINDKDDLLLEADQIEDEDYADEGDEEEETDLCERVDSSRTIEEQPCVGGLCPLSLTDQQKVAPTGSRNKNRINSLKPRRPAQNANEGKRFLQGKSVKMSQTRDIKVA